MRPSRRAPSILMLAAAVCALGLLLVFAGAVPGVIVFTAVFALVRILVLLSPIPSSVPVPPLTACCGPAPARAPPRS